MNEPTYADPVPPMRSFPQWIADHNPFFLISGVLMLAGCFMINGSAHDDPDVVWPVVGLVLVFNLYEFLVIGLAMYLCKRKGFHRDAGFLLFLEVLLLCDVSLAYNELILKNLAIGAVVASIAVAMAGVKLLTIDRGLGLRTTLRGAWAMPTLIALLFLTPGLLRELKHHEVLAEWHFHAAWWLLGALLLGSVLSQPWFTLRRYGNGPMTKIRRWTAGLLIVVPLASLFIHLRAAHYMFDHVFYVYHYAPIVLGLTAVWVIRRAAVTTPARLASVSLAGVTLAVGLSAWFPGGAVWRITASPFGTLSPLRLMLPVAAALLVYVWWRRGAWMTLPPAVLLLGCSGLGHDVSSIADRTQDLARRLRTLLTHLIPDTMLGWGAVTVAASFVFLLLGALTSLARPHPKPAQNSAE